MRKNIVNYRNKKVTVSLSFREMEEVERTAQDLCIGVPSLFRLAYRVFKKTGIKIPEDLQAEDTPTGKVFHWK